MFSFPLIFSFEHWCPISQYSCNLKFDNIFHKSTVCNINYFNSVTILTIKWYGGHYSLTYCFQHEIIGGILRKRNLHDALQFLPKNFFSKESKMITRCAHFSRVITLEKFEYLYERIQKLTVTLFLSQVTNCSGRNIFLFSASVFYFNLTRVCLPIWFQRK